MDLFVGEERAELVGSLLEQYDRCTSRSVPHLVLLEAEAGWGKTRVVQEFYTVLRVRRDPGHGYWPPSLTEVGSGVMQGRKSVYPVNPSPAPGARMPWLWWGLRCEKDSRDHRIRALDQARVQVRAHAAELTRRADRRRGDLELLADVLSEAATLVPGIGTSFGLARASAKLGPRIARRAGQLLPSAAPIGALETEFEEEVDARPELELVRRFVGSDLPLVLVVDDAHDADPTTTAVLLRLLELDAPVLVVATAWPSELAEQARSEPASESEAEFGDLVAVVEREDPTRITRHRLAPLAEADLSRLVLDHAPATDRAHVSALATNCDGNPLVLRLQLDSRPVRQSVQRGAITLNVDRLNALPDAFEDLLADRLRGLPEETQLWLAEAAWQGMRFLPTYMTRLPEPAEQDPIAAFVRPDGDQTEPGAWRFIERPGWLAVQARSEHVASATDEARWVGSVLGQLPALAEDIDDQGDPTDFGLRLDVAARALRRTAETAIDIDARIAAQLLRHVSFRARDLSRHADELAAAEEAWTWYQRVGTDDAHVAGLVRRAGALRALNRADEAIPLVDEARELAGRVAEWQESSMFDVLFQRASVLTQARHPEAASAIDQYVALDPDDLEFQTQAVRMRAQLSLDGRSARAWLEDLRDLLVARGASDEEVLFAEIDILDHDPLATCEEARALWVRVVDRLGPDHHLAQSAVTTWLQAGIAMIDYEAVEEALAELDALARSGELAPYAREVRQLAEHVLEAWGTGDPTAMAAAREYVLGAAFLSDDDAVDRDDLALFLEIAASATTGRVLPPTDDPAILIVYEHLDAVSRGADPEEIKRTVRAMLALDLSRRISLAKAVTQLTTESLVALAGQTGGVDTEIATLLLGRPTFSPLATRMVDSLAAGRPPEDSPTMPAAFRIQLLALRAALAHRDGDAELLGSTLAKLHSLASTATHGAAFGVTCQTIIRYDPDHAEDRLWALHELPHASPDARATVLRELAKHFFKAGRPEKEAPLLRRLVEGHADQLGEAQLFVVLSNLAMALQSLEQVEEEREVRLRAADLGRPESRWTAANRARLHALDGDLQLEFAERFVSCARRESADAVATGLNHLAVEMARLKLHDVARDVFAYALRSAPAESDDRAPIWAQVEKNLEACESFAGVAVDDETTADVDVIRESIVREVLKRVSF